MGANMFVWFASNWVRERKISLGICSFFVLCALLAGYKCAHSLSNPAQVIVFTEHGFFLTFGTLVALHSLAFGLILLCMRQNFTRPFGCLVIFVCAVTDGLYLGCVIASAQGIFSVLAVTLLCALPKYPFYTLVLHLLCDTIKTGGFYGQKSRIKSLLIADVLIICICAGLS